MSNSPQPLSHVRHRAASGLASTGDHVRPVLVAARRSVALLWWRIWLTVGPPVRSAGRAAARWVQRAEDAAIPALIRWAAAVPRAVQRVEEVVVPAIIALGYSLVRGLERAEGRLVPVLAGAGRSTANAVARGEGTLSAALASSGRGLVEGLQRVEAFAVPVLTPRGAPPPQPDGGEPPDGEDAGMARIEVEVDGEYMPAAAYLEIQQPEPPEEVWRHRVRTAGISLAGMLGTAAIVILTLMITARETVGTAVDQGTNAVGVEFRLPDEVGLKELTERSYIYAADGQTLQVLDREENRRIVDLAEIPPIVQQAIITAEDRRFYEHNGYDPEGIGRALFANIEAGDMTSQGASTITQQLARSAPGVGTQSEGVEAFMRKFREIAYAVALEEKFSKDELLGQYLNQVYLGENAYGVAAAAEEYFGVADVSQLQVEHAALLAAIVREPSSGNPRADPETATLRRNAVLTGMAAEGYITQEQAEAAKALPLGVIPDQERVRPYDFIADSVISEFKYNPEFAQFGATPEERERQLWFGGLRIFSSLDPRLQETAKAVISENFPNGNDPTRPTGAIVSVEPGTGRILAAHSGLDYGVEQYAIPTQGRRQPGSAAKPFIYAEALRQGFAPDIRLSGRTPAYFEGCDEWSPGRDGVKNYEDASYGSLTMPSALEDSVNTAAAQLSRVIGVEPILGLMGQMGIDVPAATNNKINCSVVLGGFDVGVTPVEMAGAYATFANNGVFVQPHFIDRIEDRAGNRLWEAQYAPTEVMSPVVNAAMVDMMQQVVNSGTATRARIRGWEVAGKTGTTDDSKDAWFVGYTPTMATAMWMGIVEDRKPLRTTGGGIPATVWQQYMAQALQGTNPVPFPDVEVPEGRLAAGQPVTVPDVTRMSRDEALAALTQVKLFAEFRSVDSRAPAGTIISQNPRPGTTAETGDAITLGVSTGEEAPPPTPTPVPQVPPPGPDNDAIRAALEALGGGRGRGNGDPGPPGDD